ncbi:hypothetical protein IFM12275_33380 [Nocardia sputorum]|uniref:Uncharacterized protein n=1 Tax=Nocardia sputorum TaxID=2984338 RepID=A0ABM8D778_9NOCA|nr:hypothetical protein IFM12275_33380 [Nocardia sputorum]BDU03303.1 hypothetical protein IFM12276_63310 [Nocardia sputorum]
MLPLGLLVVGLLVLGVGLPEEGFGVLVTDTASIVPSTAGWAVPLTVELQPTSDNPAATANPAKARRPQAS